MIPLFNLGFRPGAYEFDAKRDRKVKFHGSFGGPQTLITSVVIKCNEFGEPDTVSIIDRYKILHKIKGDCDCPLLFKSWIALYIHQKNS